MKQRNPRRRHWVHYDDYAKIAGTGLVLLVAFAVANAGYMAAAALLFVAAAAIINR